MSSIKHRHLGVKSSHRSALLRNLVTSLIERESIRTTWARAKETQRIADKLITLGKKNTNATKNKAMGILFRPDKFLPKVFGPLRERYADRPGGYTRVLRTEPLDRDTKHKPDDREYNPGQPDSAILELVDGPRDMRFAITARALARQQRREERGSEVDSYMREMLTVNVRKVTRYREDGMTQLDREVRRISERKGLNNNEDEEDEDEDDEEEAGAQELVETTSQGNDLMRRSQKSRR